MESHEERPGSDRKNAKIVIAPVPGCDFSHLRTRDTRIRVAPGDLAPFRLHPGSLPDGRSPSVPIPAALQETRTPSPAIPAALPETRTPSPAIPAARPE